MEEKSSEMIWKIWKKDKLKEKISLWKKSKLNRIVK